MTMTVVRVYPRLLERLAWVAACAVGVWVTAKLAVQFQDVLKPLVLATILAGCLEYFVQTSEYLFMTASRIVCCMLCCRCFRCRRRPAENEVPLVGDEGAASCIQIPDDVLEPWDPKYAGSNLIVRLVSVAIVLTGASIAISTLVSALVKSFSSLEVNVYKKGLLELEGAVLNMVNNTSGSVKEQIETRFSQVQTEASTAALDIINSVLASTTNLFMQAIMFLLYALMYLLAPIHSGQEVFLIVRTYLMLKCFCNALFAVCVLSLLLWIGADLALPASVVVFFLGFIPEVGAFISLAIPLPLLLLDSRVALGDRLGNVIYALVGMLLIKFIVSNGIESLVMSKSRILAGVVDSDEKADETHPVIILFFVVLCGEIWGVTGMLISVPLISLIRLLLNYERRRQMEATKSLSGSRGDSSHSVLTELATATASGLFGRHAAALDDADDTSAHDTVVSSPG
eukprot:TRINITY_DN7153_c0_g1_i1.p1 TRINITY_DN7153_c0_g1~~TRINITY_DN7153_c0_g1_i1.p1  ORF type:complete len:457 (+),score=69.63 TRINITY_DN7153_c0_g1_i1:70-1440(+)